MSDLFGDKLLIKHCSKIDKSTDSHIQKVKHDTQDMETLVARDALKGKVVCLFFSASWCTPCQQFVPLLKEIYTELVRRGDPLEVVFISFDKTEAEMIDYYRDKHGNWLALPFEDTFKDFLAERYSISMVPRLVVVQPNGDVITSKGRKDIQDKGVICMRGWQAALVLSEEEETQVE